ncbi:D amino acid oxidase [Vibrio cholerae]|nr:D amino acid oxidase [Vibrio cholerae]
MALLKRSVDAVIIGGGFYGSVIALYLQKTRGLRRIVIVEQEPELLSRASYNNQAREKWTPMVGHIS